MPSQLWNWLRRALPPKEEHPHRPDLEARVREIAQQLGMPWPGTGGVVRQRLPSGREVWRVYDEWVLGPSGFADLDAASEELLSIQEAPPQRDIVMPIPAHKVPDEAELLAFARQRLEILNWPMPRALVVAPGRLSPAWVARSVDPEVSVVVEFRGARGRLSLTRASRASDTTG